MCGTPGHVRYGPIADILAQTIIGCVAQEIREMSAQSDIQPSWPLSFDSPLMLGDGRVPRPPAAPFVAPAVPAVLRLLAVPRFAGLSWTPLAPPPPLPAANAGQKAKRHTTNRLATST